MDDLKNLISLREAAKISGYHPDYISSLIRAGKIKGRRIGRNWFTTADAVESYHLTKKFVPADEIIRRKISPLKVLMALTFAALVVIGISLSLSKTAVISQKDAEAVVVMPVDNHDAPVKTVFYTE